MEDLSSFIQDIVENSLNVQAENIQLLITEDTLQKTLLIEIIDDGIGMSEETLQKVEDPFYTTRTTRKVGLGLSFFKQSVLQTEGKFKITSTLGEGTSVFALYNTFHIDMPPVGDLSSTIQTILAHPALKHFIYNHQIDDANFRFDTEEVKNVLGVTSFNDVTLLQDIKQYIQDLLDNIRGGKL
ncbi:MAG: ATP-binding protein [Candidatus Izemoplasmatales bacterium]